MNEKLFDVDSLRILAFKLSCEDQYRLAFFIAENVGYTLQPEIEPAGDLDNIVKGNFESEGFSLGDKRAMALHDWLADLGRPATAKEMKAEMDRLKRIMPASEDIPAKEME
jgi:hypothetical protein